MPFGDVPGALALITSLKKRVDILKDIRPVESCLEDLVGRFGCVGVPTVGGRMTMGKVFYSLSVMQRKKCKNHQEQK